MSTADEIKKLNELLRDRVISQEEFDAQKDKLLKKTPGFLFFMPRKLKNFFEIERPLILITDIAETPSGVASAYIGSSFLTTFRLCAAHY